MGMENKAAPRVTIMVPHSSGSTPYELGSRSGTHLVPRKKLAGLTSSKKPAFSLKRIKMITQVVATEISAQRASADLINDSPQRFFFAVMSIPGISEIWFNLRVPKY